MTISTLQLPLPSRLPRTSRATVSAPDAARLRAAQRWSPVPGSARDEIPQLRQVAFAGGTSLTALPVWTGWTMPAMPAHGADAA